VDVRDIVVDHVDTLRNEASGRRSTIDFVVFYAVPAAFLALAERTSLELSHDAVGVLVTALAVFAGLLLNLLLLTHGIIKGRDRTKNDVNEMKLLHQIYSNISYAILVSILALALLLSAAAIGTMPIGTHVAALTAFLISHFLLTLLMILKRMHILLGREFTGRPT
jgi:hypothetical protein